MDPVDLSREEVERYWLRLAPPTAAKAEAEDRGFLIVENGTAECKVGFELTQEVRCPLVGFDHKTFTLDRLGDTLQIFGQIIRTRAARHA